MADFENDEYEGPMSYINGPFAKISIGTIGIIFTSLLLAVLVNLFGTSFHWSVILVLEFVYILYFILAKGHRYVEVILPFNKHSFAYAGSIPPAVFLAFSLGLVVWIEPTRNQFYVTVSGLLVSLLVLWSFVDSQSPVTTSMIERRWRKKWQFDVFICHSGTEKNEADTLKRALQNVGLESFLDERSLHHTGRSEQDIDKALHSSRFGIVILSPEFLRRPYPMNELKKLWMRYKTEKKGYPQDHGVIYPVFYKITVDDLCSSYTSAPEEIRDLTNFTGHRSNERRLFADAATEIAEKIRDMTKQEKRHWLDEAVKKEQRKALINYSIGYLSSLVSTFRPTASTSPP